MPAERQKQALAALLALLVVVGVWQYMAADGASAPQATVAARRAAAADMPQPPVDVSLDALEGGRLGPDDGGRNPFVFTDRPSAAPPVFARPSADAAIGTPADAQSSVEHSSGGLIAVRRA